MALPIQGVGMALGDSLLCSTAAAAAAAPVPQSLCRRRCGAFFPRASTSPPLALLSKAVVALSTRPSRWPKLLHHHHHHHHHHKEMSARNRAAPPPTHAQPSSSSKEEEHEDGGDGPGTAAAAEEEEGKEKDNEKERKGPGLPELQERERKRRLRISSANKGRVPWNKGKTHKPETIERIRKTLKKVMNKPEVRAKLRLCAHPHSEETKEKLRQIMLAKTRAQKVQLSCLVDWRESIAEAARVGGYGEEELQWNSYMILKEALIREEKAGLEEIRRKRRSAPRKPWTEEQKKKISKSLKARWADLTCKSLDFRLSGGQLLCFMIISEEGVKSKELQIFLIQIFAISKRLVFANFLDHYEVEKFESKTITTMGESKNNLHLAFSEASNIKERDMALTKVGCYNDPNKQEKLEKLKRLKSITSKSREHFSNVENTFANASEHSMSQRGQIYQTISHSSKMETTQATIDTTSLKSYHKARAKAQMEATKRAILLMEKAKSAANAAAKALEQSNTKDEKVESSLEMALDLISDAHKSIKTVQFQG